ncbi:metal ABC transporter solute-binding protein, Zn/Mn family [Actinophytocola sp.]|uniref:metal ABC transporter solute-binding protein, Zn/Mn family n=1 Tax=Actinophytocola sp. TaxID=1872138 RepID=UPI002D7EAB0D|nr:zinc ABC transporter substrate-binding protein [Actinophytocola sp.]HET9139675.1 zinc ABC transporter substrate-binding protein [Actinophytocola sp.]
MISGWTRVLGPGLLLAAMVAGCGSDPTTPDTGPGIRVVASTNVWGSVVRAVGGDAVHITSIIDDPAADPHAFEERPEHAAAVAEARLVVTNGGGYDDFMTGLLDRTGPDTFKIVAFQVSRKPPGANEHVWYDLATVRAVADEIAVDLGTIAPDRASTFLANAKAFDTAMETLTDKAAAIGPAHPGSRVAATEPVADYLVATAGLTDVTPPEFSQAVAEETDPPAAAVAEITDLVGGGQVAALLNNPQAETPTTNAVTESATRGGVPVVDVTETLPAGVTGYLDWMTGQVSALGEAVAKQ